MKRFHVHVAVTNLAKSVEFYSKLFGQSPSAERSDYAKWMLDDPRVNFAISSRGHSAGVNHFGVQAETAAELEGLKHLADAASGDTTLVQKDAVCCYARSDKHWTVDPQGLAWEHFQTLSEAQVYGADTATQAGPCCIPLRESENDDAKAKQACCIPQAEAAATAACCS